MRDRVTTFTDATDATNDATNATNVREGRDALAVSRRCPLRDTGGVVVLVAYGAVSIGLWLCMAQWDVLAHHARDFIPLFSAQLLLYAFAAAWLHGQRLTGRGALTAIFAVALLMRLALVWQTPTASDDIYRYVWDGHIQAAGINPYQYPPEDAALIRFRDPAIYPGINRKPVRTIYPPVAEVIFRLVYTLHPNSVTWTKLAFSLLDLGIAALLARMLHQRAMNPCLVLLYAWHPLLVLEVAHSGHVDIAAVLFLLLAIGASQTGQRARAGVWLACAVLVKFYALAALPALMSGALRRRDFRLPLAFAATVVVAYVPFLSVGSHVFGFLGGYAAEEGFVSGDRYFFLQQGLRLIHRLFPVRQGMGYALAPLWLQSPATLYTALMAAVLGAVALWCVVQPPTTWRAIADRTVVLLLLLFIFTTASQPWYLLVLLVCVPLVARPLAIASSIVVACGAYGYLHWWFDARPVWPWWVEYGSRAVALAMIVAWGISLIIATYRRREWVVESPTGLESAI